MTSSARILGLWSLLGSIACTSSGSGDTHDPGKDDRSKRSAHASAVAVCVDDHTEALNDENADPDVATKTWAACLDKANRAAIPAIDAVIDTKQFMGAAPLLDAFDAHAAKLCKIVRDTFPNEGGEIREPECRGDMALGLAHLIDKYVAFADNIPTIDVSLARHDYMTCYLTADRALEKGVGDGDYIAAYDALGACIVSAVRSATDDAWLDLIAIDYPRADAVKKVDAAYASLDEAITAACTIAHNADINAGGSAAQVVQANCEADASDLMSSHLSATFRLDL